ncbi:hypothetical protein V6K52_00830 [Knoellia sp. S7-12]|uniref:hypothetical protein n=1 Tax=Knoellia sp. S7-12 TaxID=3126698 RepID=UPI0033666C1A
MTWGLTMVTAAALAGCGSERPDPRAGEEPSASVSTPNDQVIDPDETLVASGMLMQRTADGPVELCVGGVAESYPPQCGGPTLVGEIDWDTLTPERASGVTWSNGTVWAIGHFAPQTGKLGTFTLTQPLQQKPPAGISLPSPGQAGFPQLCEDPYADGGSKRVSGPEVDTNALSTLLPTLDGYVGSWVSDGSTLFNVLVTGDAAAAHREIRTVWKGGLCVEQRDLPTEADITAAQEALSTQSREIGLLSTAGDSQGSLDAQATFVDAATRARILEIVRPWLSPDQVRITSAIQPLTQ